MSQSAHAPWQCRLSLSDLFARAGVQAVDGAPIPTLSIRSITDDSRKVEPGACFVAVRGTKLDGHAHIHAALAAGADAIVADRDCSLPPAVVHVRVADTRRALARLAAAWYGLLNGTGPALRLIGITGTNGKTTTAWLLRSILCTAGRATALLGTIEYDLIRQRRSAPLTTPGSVELCGHLAEARSAGAAFAVLEVSSHALDQHRCDGLTFDAGVFTNLSGDHLDYHQTMQAYGAAKRRLFDLLGRPGVAVINGDDAFGRSLLRTLDVRAISYGVEHESLDVSAHVEAVARWGSRFTIRSRSFSRSVSCALAGRHNVSNALAAAAAAHAVGVEPDMIVEGLSRVAAVPGRLQRVEPDGWPFSVLVDYAHTDAALANVLETTRPLTPGRLICVFGCGGDRDCTKRPRMARATERFADVAYVTSDNPRTEDPIKIIDEIILGFGRPPACRVHVEADRRLAIGAAIAEAQPGDTVLIAGKGHETYQLVGSAVLPFDDVQVARQWLVERSVGMPGSTRDPVAEPVT